MASTDKISWRLFSSKETWAIGLDCPNGSHYREVEVDGCCGYFNVSNPEDGRKDSSIFVCWEGQVSGEAELHLPSLLAALTIADSLGHSFPSSKLDDLGFERLES